MCRLRMCEPAARPSPEETPGGHALPDNTERTWTPRSAGVAATEYLLTPLSTVLEITDKKAAELEPTD